MILTEEELCGLLGLQGSKLTFFQRHVTVTLLGWDSKKGWR